MSSEPDEKVPTLVVEAHVFTENEDLGGVPEADQAGDQTGGQPL